MLLRNSRTRAWVIQGTLIVALAAFAALIYLTTITNPGTARHSGRLGLSRRTLASRGVRVRP